MHFKLKAQRNIQKVILQRQTLLVISLGYFLEIKMKIMEIIMVHLHFLGIKKHKIDDK